MTDSNVQTSRPVGTDPIAERLELRLKLLANGYSPLANPDKTCRMFGWPTIVIDEATISKWTRRIKRLATTGLRVDGGLMVMDLDIDDQALVDRILARIDELLPAGTDWPLERHGKGAKVALYLKTEEPFGRIASRGFIRPGETADDCVHRLETFGGTSPRQFGSFGPHTVDDAGNVLVEYRWEGPSPADVPLADLPILPKAVVHAITDAVEEILQEAGWSIHAQSHHGETGAHDVQYDLIPEMRFEMNDGRRLSLAELAQEAADGTTNLRCSASFVEGASAKNTRRCLVGVNHAGHLRIWESAAGVSHMELAIAPPDHAPLVAAVGERLAALMDRQVMRPDRSDDAWSCAAKYLASYAYCPSAKEGVLSFLNPSEKSMTLTAFRSLSARWNNEIVGPRGGVTKLSPVDLWLGDHELVTVQGVYLRPDKPRPLFEENGLRYVNGYEPPSHPTDGGDPDPGVAFIAHLLPDAEERRWFTQWLSYKVQHPHVPGPAVVMVAKDYGTGRGTLAELIKRMLGSRYVASIPFATFAGTNAQSQYQEWLAESLMVVVNESSKADEVKPWQRKHDVYEMLKELVEPAGMERYIVQKGIRSDRMYVSASFLFLTNNHDAFPIPEDDRRVAVLSNGGVPADGYFDRLRDWMDDKRNVAAFLRWLEAVDLADYSPFKKPLKTRAKEMMADAAVSDIERAVEAVLEDVDGVVVADQIVEKVRDYRETNAVELPDRWESIVRKILARRWSRVGVRNGQNWLPMVGGKRHPCYARNAREASTWTKVDAAVLRDAIEGNGALVTVSMKEAHLKLVR